MATPMNHPQFTVGIEEEYLLVDKESRDVVLNPAKEIFIECEQRASNNVVEHELLRSQIEVETQVCQSIPEAGEELKKLRQLASEVASQYNIAPIAASTHPFGQWHEQLYTDKKRYHKLFLDMQSLAQRLLICGMHVHVGIGDDELRVKLLNQFSQFLPLIHSLSTSSPFWEGENTGLKSYRLTVFDNFPRSGLPEQFQDYADYIHHIDILKRAKILDDATFIWWDMRISARYPTLECRISDVCTRLEDAIAIAALIQSLLHYLYRIHVNKRSFRIFPRFLVDQNRWRSIRYGFDEGFVDFENAQVVPVSKLLTNLVEMLMEDASELGCESELQNILKIPNTGTSAHKQISIYDNALQSGTDSRQALNNVVDMLIQDSVNV